MATGGVAPISPTEPVLSELTIAQAHHKALKSKIQVLQLSQDRGSESFSSLVPVMH